MILGIALIVVPILVLLGFILRDVGLKEFLEFMMFIAIALAMSSSITAGIYLVSQSM